MPHYKIKCVRCAHEATNDTVLFDVKDTVMSSTAMISEQNRSISVGGRAQDGQTTNSAKEDGNESNFWDETDDEETSNANKRESQQVDRIIKGDLMTYPMMVEYCEQNGLGEVQPIYQHVKVTPDFLREDLFDPSPDLLTGMRFREDVNGAERLASKRYCPVCKCELPARSGAMPTYNVTIMGTTASGKTVYLCALSSLLTQASGNLPYRGSLSSSFASRNGSTIANLAHTMFTTGVLPGTTQALLNDPLVLQLTFSVAGRSKECLFALSDMRGEDFTLGGGANLLVRAEPFSKADGFMMVISPLNIPAISYYLAGEDAGTHLSAHMDLIGSIRDYICPFMPTGKITAPSVVMLSKGDVLIRGREILEERLGLPRGNPALLDDFPHVPRYTGEYFRGHNRGARQVIGLDSNLASFLANTFNDPYCTSFSSLGSDSTIESDEESGTHKVSSFARGIRPIRVENPILYLLIRFGFLPNYQMMEKGERYEKHNCEILSEWIQTHT